MCNYFFADYIFVGFLQTKTLICLLFVFSEAVVCRCSSKYMFLKILQYWLEWINAGVFLWILRYAQNKFVTDPVYVQPYKSSLHIELTICCFAFSFCIPLKSAKRNRGCEICKFYKMIYVVPRLFITFHYSGLLFIVPRTTASLFIKYCGVCQLQENNPKILEYFDFATSSDKLLIQQKKLWCSWRFQNNVSLPISKEPRGALRTMSSI